MRTRTSPTANSPGLRPGGGPNGAASGFSLLEMLVVLVVLGLAAATVTLGFSRRGDRMTVSGLASEAASHARAARHKAIETGRDTVLVVDVARRQITSGGARRSLSIPADLDVEVVASLSERAGAGASGIRFFPDGASTGGTIRVGQAGSMHEVRINWFTGRVQVVPPP